MPLFRSGKPRVRLRRTADVVLPAGVNTIVWQVADFDDVGGWDGISTYSFDRAGLYLVGSTIQRAATASGSGPQLLVQLNGANVATALAVSSTSAVRLQATSLIEVGATDQLRVQCQLHSSATATLVAAASQLWCTRIGPVAWT